MAASSGAAAYVEFMACALRFQIGNHLLGVFAVRSSALCFTSRGFAASWTIDVGRKGNRTRLRGGLLSNSSTDIRFSQFTCTGPAFWSKSHGSWSLASTISIESSVLGIISRVEFSRPLPPNPKLSLALPRFHISSRLHALPFSTQRYQWLVLEKRLRGVCRTSAFSALFSVPGRW